MGTHKALLKRNGLYAQLWSEQETERTQNKPII